MGVQVAPRVRPSSAGPGIGFRPSRRNWRPAIRSTAFLETRLRRERNRSNEDGLPECMVLAINDGLQHGAARTGRVCLLIGVKRTARLRCGNRRY